MAQDAWSTVDEYVTGLLALPDEVLTAAVRASEEAGLPAIQVSPPQGKLLQLLAQTLGAKAILEFGTLGGYSTIWLGRALPEDGRLITLEADPRYAEVAQGNIARAGLSERVELRVGPALDLLPGLDAEGAGPFDLVFIDADKPNYQAYYEAVLPLLAENGLVIADNVLWSGRVVEPDGDESTEAIKAFNEHVAGDDRVVSVMLTVRDGMTLVQKR